MSVYFRVRIVSQQNKKLEKKTKARAQQHNHKRRRTRKELETAVNLKQYPTVDICMHTCTFIMHLYPSETEPYIIHNKKCESVCMSELCIYAYACTT